MNSFYMIACVLGMTARGALGLSLHRVQEQDTVTHVHGHKDSAVAGAELSRSTTDLSLNLTEQGFDAIAGLPDDKKLVSFLRRFLALEDKYVPKDREDEFIHFVHWFRGTVSSSSLRGMRRAMSGRSFIRDLKDIDGASVSEGDYQAVAELHNDTAMKLFVNAVLTAEERFVPEGKESALAGFLPLFSGTQVKTLDEMRKQLLEQPWVRKMKDVVASALPGDHKQAEAGTAKTGHKEINASGDQHPERNASGISNFKSHEDVLAGDEQKHDQKGKASVESTNHQKVIAREAVNASGAKRGDEEHNESIELTNHQKAIARDSVNASGAKRGQEEHNESVELTNHKKAIARDSVNASAAKVEQEEGNSTEELLATPWVMRKVDDVVGSIITNSQNEAKAAGANTGHEEANESAELTNHQKAIAREASNASVAKRARQEANESAVLNDQQKALPQEIANASAVKHGLAKVNMTEELSENPWVKEVKDVIESILPHSRKEANASAAKSRQEANASAASTNHQKAIAREAVNARGAKRGDEEHNESVELTNHKKAIAREVVNASGVKRGQEEHNESVELTNHQKLIAREAVNASGAKRGDEEHNESVELTNHQRAIARDAVNASAANVGQEGNSTEELLATPWVVQRVEDVVGSIFSHNRKRANASVANSNESAELTNHQKAIAREREEANTSAELTNHQKAVAREEPNASNGAHIVANETADAAGSAPPATPGMDLDDAPGSQCLSCIVWGEASILSFNAYHRRALAHPSRSVELYARQQTSDQHSVSDEGTYWLVKNWNVQIQGRYWHYNRTKHGLGLGAIAISGHILGDNVLVIRSRSGPVMWNDQEILRRVNSSFTNEFVSASYVSTVGMLAGDIRARGLKLKFANGVRLTVARYRTKLSAHISLCDYHVGAASMDGQCGDFHRRPGAKEWVWLDMQRAAKKLRRSESLFPDSHSKSNRGHQ